MDSTSGQTAESIWDTGKVILWMTLEFTLGKMVECMKVFTKRTRNTDMVFILGLIQRNMLDGGMVENNMASVSLFLKKVNVDLGSGKTARSLDGSMRKRPSK